MSGGVTGGNRGRLLVSAVQAALALMMVVPRLPPHPGCPPTLLSQDALCVGQGSCVHSDGEHSDDLVGYTDGHSGHLSQACGEDRRVRWGGRGTGLRGSGPDGHCMSGAAIAGE